MSRTRYADVETVPVTSAMIDLADRRTEALIRASINFPNAIRQMVRSAYVQGLEDGCDACGKHLAGKPRGDQEGT